MEHLEQLAKNMMPETIEWYEHLHTIPELGFEEFETTKYIIEQLSKLENIEILTPHATGCVAVLKGRQDGPTIGIRADIDALPLVEEADVPYKSKNEGKMHACGHDGHTVMLLAAAKILNNEVNDIKGTIKFIFQPAEELFPGGAVGLVESGVLDDVDYFFGTHLMPTYPTGKVMMKSGTIFASCDSFDITIQGKGGHAAVPNMAVDPVVTAAELIMAYQTIVARKTHPFYRPIVSTTVWHTPIGAENVIPDTCQIGASIRNVDEDVRAETRKWIEQITNDVCAAHGASATIDYEWGYAPVINDQEAFLFTKIAASAAIKDEDIIILKDSIQASEDFGAYRKIAPINYFLVGSGNADKEADIYPHHPKYKVDTDAFYTGILMHISIANTMLIQKVSNP